MSAIRIEALPFLATAAILFGIFAIILRLKRCRGRSIFFACCVPALVSAAYLLYFFRDPERTPPQDPTAVLAGADGVVTSISKMHEPQYMQTDCIRISIFLSLFDVHVNRAPIAGESTFLGYFPGKRFFTFEEKSSEFNQHNKILITNNATKCMVTQIVGPVCRRVVYWPPHDRPVQIAAGDRIGMMKFGSRMDIYLPETDVVIVAQISQKVRAGETVLARIRQKDANAQANIEKIAQGENK